jgi:hypothetical protein
MSLAPRSYSPPWCRSVPPAARVVSPRRATRSRTRPTGAAWDAATSGIRVAWRRHARHRCDRGGDPWDRSRHPSPLALAAARRKAASRCSHRWLRTSYATSARADGRCQSPIVTWAQRREHTARSRRRRRLARPAPCSSMSGDNGRRPQSAAIKLCGQRGGAEPT